MNGIYSAVSGVLVLLSFLLMVWAGLSAVKKHANFNAFLLLSGSLISLLCYGLLKLGWPPHPPHGEAVSQDYYILRQLFSEVTAIMLPLGYVITAAAVLRLVRESHNKRL